MTGFDTQDGAIARLTCYLNSGRLSIMKLVDETGVVLDVETMSAYALNATGMFLLDRVRLGSETISSLVGVLVEAYEVTPEEAQRDVGDFLAAFSGLLPGASVDQCGDPT